MAKQDSKRRRKHHTRRRPVKAKPPRKRRVGRKPYEKKGISLCGRGRRQNRLNTLTPQKKGWSRKKKAIVGSISAAALLGAMGLGYYDKLKIREQLRLKDEIMGLSPSNDPFSDDL